MIGKAIELLPENERIVLRELEKHGFIVIFHADGEHKYFVGAGSHGGSGRTLNQAMKKCLGCCDIYKYWKCDFGEGENALMFFDRLRNTYLKPH